MDNISYFLKLLPSYLQEIISSFGSNVLDNITEIRMRRNKPLVIYIKDKLCFISIDGKLVSNYSQTCVCINDEEFEAAADRLCNNSYHTNMNSMIDGFITTKSGCRVGISSTAVYKNNEIVSVKDISSINIRISHAILNCSRNLLNALYLDHTPSIIIAGTGGSGKTTLLRDMARLLSSGYNSQYKKTVIIDERNEIASNFDVGINTDVLIGFEKAKGIENATRTLSPDIIICDEIGNESELEAIKFGFSSGVKFIVSVHMGDVCQIETNKIVRGLIDSNEFDYIVLLKNYTDDFEIIDISEVNRENHRNDNDNSFFIFPWFNGG